MKYTIAAIISAFAATTLASPASPGYTLRSADDVLASGAETALMVFHGQAFVDGPNVTLSGTAESVYAQLLDLNPAYDAWDFPEYQERMAALGISRETPQEETVGLLAAPESGLKKRGGIQCNPVGGHVGNAQTQCLEGRLYLERLNGYCGAPPGWGGCSRVSCSNGCGVFLCNDNPYPIDVWCGNLAGDMDDIHRACGRRYESTSGVLVVQLKGQVFRDGPPAWNTIVRSENC